MANEAALADQSRTIFGNRAEAVLARALERTDNAEHGIRLFGEHVARFIGLDRPWSAYGRVAIQQFRAPGPAIYFIGGDVGLIKIGLSVCPLERLASFQLGSPVDLRILALTLG